MIFFFFFFKQKTAYEMRISDWSSDVCSSDLTAPELALLQERHHDLDHSAERGRRGSRATLREVHRYFELILIQGRSPGWPNPIRNSKPRLRSSRPSRAQRRTSKRNCAMR